MAEWVKIISQWFSGPRVLGILFLATATIVLIGEVLRFQPFLDAVKEPRAHLLLWLLVVSVSGLATYPLEIGWEKATASFHNRAAKRKLIKRVQYSTPSEKKVLGLYLQSEQRTLGWDKGGGTVDLLARDGILTLITHDPNSQFRQDVYMIDKDVWDYLNANPAIIDLERNQ